jgi:flavin-dependent dehydrogenase
MFLPPMLDALVIGAGPAGSVTARLLARSGWEVLLVEKADFPRRKVCGEFLSATSLPLLEACGIGDAYDRAAGPVVTRVGLFAGDAIVQSPKERKWGRALNRATLDTLLLNAAMAAGADLIQPAEVTALREGIAILDDGHQISARHIIFAGGSWATNGLFAIETPSDLFAFKAHFRGAQLWPGLMPLLAFPGGYGGLVHSDGGLVSLSFCIRRAALEDVRRRYGGKAGEAVLAHIRATTRGVAQVLEGAVLAGAVLATGPIHPGIRPRRRGNVLYVGNSAGEAHPIVAEGISMALQGGGLLAKLLLQGREAYYPQAWRRCFAPRIRAAALFAGLAMNGAGRAAAQPIITAFPRILDWGAALSGKH